MRRNEIRLRLEQEREAGAGAAAWPTAPSVGSASRQRDLAVRRVFQSDKPWQVALAFEAIPSPLDSVWTVPAGA